MLEVVHDLSVVLPRSAALTRPSGRRLFKILTPDLSFVVVFEQARWSLRFELPKNRVVLIPKAPNETLDLRLAVDDLSIRQPQVNLTLE